MWSFYFDIVVTFDDNPFLLLGSYSLRYCLSRTGLYMISSCEHGDPGIIHCDLSKGIENVAVAVHEGESLDDLPGFDQSFTYVRSLAIHSSITMDGLSPLCWRRKAQSSKNHGTSTDVDVVCHCKMGGEETPYLSTGLLHPQYIQQVHVAPLCLYRNGWQTVNVFCFINFLESRLHQV